MSKRRPFAPTVEGGSAVADIGMASRATALVAFNDLFAIGVLERLQDMGIDAPGELLTCNGSCTPAVRDKCLSGTAGVFGVDRA